MSLHSADWDQLGKYCFRKIQMYELKQQNGWPVLDNLTFACADSGGPIALANNIDEQGVTKRNFAILIFTGAGQPISRIQWKSGELVRMAWSEKETLLCVRSDGQVLVYDLFGSLLEEKHFSMGNEAQELKIKSVEIFSSYTGCGICVLTGSNRFYLVNNVDEPKIWRTAEIIGRNSIPTAWTVFSKNRQTCVCACIGSEIHFLDSKQADQIMPVFRTSVKTIVAVDVSPDTEKVAFLSENGWLLIGTIDLKESLCEMDCKCRKKPTFFAWCGNSGVCMYDDQVFTLASLSGESTQFFFDGSIALGKEIDGIHIYSQNSHEFLSAVPEVTRQIFGVGSMSPGSLLVEASKEFKAGSYRANEYATMIEKNLPEAVQLCVSAAVAEFQPSLQRMLLEAAEFGKAFASEIPSDLYVNACRYLRVLNVVRSYHIGIPLTFEQLENLTVAVFINRLLARRQWPLAVKICEYLRIPADQGVNKILSAWAIYKLSQRNINDQEIAASIRSKFGEFPSVSYVEVAKKAADLGRKQLAILLLDAETQVTKQVGLLLELGKNEKALYRAAESGDRDLIFFVILRLKDALDKKGDLFFILRKFPIAFAVYKQYCRSENPEHLRALYEQEDDFESQASCWLQECKDLSEFDVREKFDALKNAAKCYSSAKDDLSAKLVEEEVRLLQFQEQFSEKFLGLSVDSSLKETLCWLIENKEFQKAEAIRKDFKLSEKQFWWWKIEALAKSKQWTELEQFSKSKKPPFGFIPFVECCCKYNNVPEAKKYLSKIPSEEKVRALIKMNELEEAAKSAFELKDLQALNSVLVHCGPQSRGLTEKILQFKQQLSQSSNR